MKEKKTTIPPAGAVKPTTANKKPLLMMALPIIVAVLLLFVPVPEGLPPYAWHYFAIFVGVIVGLIFEPLPGAVIGITGVVVIALCSQWLLFSPDQMAAPGFKMAGASFKWAVSGFGNSTVWLIFGAFMFAAGYDKTQFGRRLALILVKYLGRRSLTLGYAITFADLLLAPFTPSNTARSGGTIYPIIANLPPLYGSKPNDPSARKIGSYLMWVAITAACITSSMFLSALAPNLLALALVKSIVGINISWGTWFIAFLPLGILLILAMPLLAYWFYPPEVKVNNEVPLWAARELEKLGKLSRNEILLLVFVCFALMMWIFAADWIEPALAALLVIVLMLWTGVLSWSDITNNKAAWNTFVWFATLVALADGLSSTGFIAWLGKEGGALMSGISPGMVTISRTNTSIFIPGHADHCLDYPGNEYGSVCPADGHLAGRDGDHHPVRYWPKPNLLRQRLPADQRLLAPRHHLWRHLPGRPAADWLSVDVHDVLIHNRRDYPGGFYLYGVSDYVD